MLVDKIETIQGSVIQHGHNNDRIYLMHLQSREIGDLVGELDRMADENGYGKIFAKIPATHWQTFRDAGYVKEAEIPGFFRGRTNGLFVGKYLSAERQVERHPRTAGQPGGKPAGRPQHGDDTLSINACTPADAKDLAAIYRRAFASYPFPIHQPGFLVRMMAGSTSYYCVRCKGEIVAAAAAEIDPPSQTCEMTDFATEVAHQGKGLAGKLLEQLEVAARQEGVKTAYTIARIDAYGMNRVFEKSGYRHAGRLINNSQIGGCIRSMSVWYKHLQPPSPD